MKIKLTLAFALITLCSLSAYAQQNKRTYRVFLQVGGNDQIKSDIISYVSRELRSLGDIVIVDSPDSDCLIWIVGAIPRIQSGFDLGYALSVVATEIKDKDYLNSLVPECLSKEDWRRKALNTELTLGEILDQHFLYIGSDLRKLCSDVVAAVDGDVFEKARKKHQSLDDAMQKLQKEMQEQVQQQLQKQSTPARTRTTKKRIQ